MRHVGCITVLSCLLWVTAVPGAARAQGIAAPAEAEVTAAPPLRSPAPLAPALSVLQVPEPPETPRRFLPELFRGMGDALKHMPRKNSLYWVAAGGVLALAVHPLDDDINARLVGSSIADTAFKPGKYVGSLPVLFGTAVTTYVIGRTGDRARTRHLGMDMMQATLLSEAITEAIKFSVRRERPLHPDGTRNSGYAFPSGHSTMTFAVATVLQQHLGWRAAVPTYAAAAYVAASRLHDNRHYASDVVMGAANGIIIGRSITWHGRNFYASALPVPRGVGVSVQVRGRATAQRANGAS